MARTKSTDVYEVILPITAKRIYVEAQGKQDAKSIITSGITINKLSGREVRDVIASGATIIDGSDAPAEPFGKDFIASTELADEPAGDA